MNNTHCCIVCNVYGCLSSSYIIYCVLSCDHFYCLLHSCVSDVIFVYYKTLCLERCRTHKVYYYDWQMFAAFHRHSYLWNCSSGDPWLVLHQWLAATSAKLMNVGGLTSSSSLCQQQRKWRGQTEEGREDLVLLERVRAALRDRTRSTVTTMVVSWLMPTVTCMCVHLAPAAVMCSPLWSSD